MASQEPSELGDIVAVIEDKTPVSVEDPNFTLIGNINVYVYLKKEKYFNPKDFVLSADQLEEILGKENIYYKLVAEEGKPFPNIFGPPLVKFYEVHSDSEAFTKGGTMRTNFEMSTSNNLSVLLDSFYRRAEKNNVYAGDNIVFQTHPYLPFMVLGIYLNLSDEPSVSLFSADKKDVMDAREDYYHASRLVVLATRNNRILGRKKDERRGALVAFVNDDYKERIDELRRSAGLPEGTVPIKTTPNTFSKIPEYAR